MPTNSPLRDDRRSRRVSLLRIILVLAAGVASFVAVRSITRPDAPSLVAKQDVPDDVQVELDTTWSAFTDRFGGRHRCIGDVNVRLVSHLEDGDARYDASEEAIEIRIPTTPARFRESLVHELAHHTERSCGAFDELREQLHPLLGGVDVPWASGPVWYDVPSERFAEHVVHLVNGTRIRHTEEIDIDADVLLLIAAWADG